MLVVASIISCVAILIVVVYSSFTLNYGEEEELSSAPVHVIHTVSIDTMLITGEHDCLNLQTLLGMTWKQNQTFRVPKLEFEAVPAARHLFKKKNCVSLQLSIKLGIGNHKTHAGLDRHFVAPFQHAPRVIKFQQLWVSWLKVGIISSVPSTVKLKRRNELALLYLRPGTNAGSPWG